DILAMLLAECEQVGVTIATRCEVRAVQALVPEPAEYNDTVADVRARRQGERFTVEYFQHGKAATDARKLACQSLVVATGALSIPTLGGSGLGYDIAAQFSLPLTERRAGLVPFMFSDAMKAV